MIKEDDLSNLCRDVCEEFQALGIKKDRDPRTLKESFNILKRPTGQWFKTSKLSLHEKIIETQIDFNIMVKLKKLTELLDQIDSDIKKNGGRIFITEDVVTKIKKGSESVVMVDPNQNNSGPYRSLCDELTSSGLEKDRYRTEETFMLTKSKSGEWSLSVSHENHSGERRILDMAKLSQLNAIAVKIGRADPLFQSNGGRVFITPTRIYRLKNKKEINFKF